jgi:hypothetical protein
MIILICFLLINPAYANDKFNISFNQRIDIISINETKYPMPVFVQNYATNVISYPSHENRSYENKIIMDVETQNKTVPAIPIYLNKNNIPEYFFFMINLDNDSLNSIGIDNSSLGIKFFNNQLLEYRNSPPFLKYDNKTLIYKWEICWQKDNNMVCSWQKQQNDFFLNWTFRYAELKNRFDLYTISDFNTKSNVQLFCPLSLDLGIWAQNMVYFVNSTGGLQVFSSNITNYEIHNGKIYQKVNETFRFEKDTYDSGSLILIGSNISVIITKPSLGLFNSSPNYFFKTEISPNGSLMTFVCTDKHYDKLIPPKGISAYFIFGESPNIKKLFEMSMLLSNLQDPIVYPPEIVQVKFFKGSILPLGSITIPEVIIKMDFTTEEKNIQYLTFNWNREREHVNKTIKILDGTFIFEQPILLNNSAWMYPFDTYDAIIYIDPPVIKETTRSLSFNSGEPYEGIAKFENSGVLLSINRNINSKLIYFIWLIFSIVFFFYAYPQVKILNKQVTQTGNQEKTQLEKLGFILLLLGYFFNGFSDNHIFSIGTIPFVIMIFWLMLFFLLKK